MSQFNNKKRRLENKKKLSSLYKEDYNYRKNIKKRKKKRKNKKNVFLRILFLIILVLIFIVSLFYLITKLLYKNKDYNEIKAFYSSEDYDKSFKQYNDNLHYNRFEKNNGEYIEIKSSNYEIINSVKNGYEDIVFQNLKKYFDDNNINQSDVSIYITKDGNEILSINSEVKYLDYDIKDYINLILIKKTIEEGIYNVNDEINIYESDISYGGSIYNASNIGNKVKLDRILNDAYTKYDETSKNIINRLLINAKIDIEKSIDYINNIEEGYSVKDISMLIQEYEKGSTTLNSVFDYYLKEKNDLFIKTIYSPIGNKNIIKNETSVKYDAGIVNTSNKYIYSIFSEKLSEENINIIGDIINRTIDNQELINKIYE